MPDTPNPVQLSRPELYDLVQQLITDPLYSQNTAAQVRAALNAMIASAAVPASDGAGTAGTGNAGGGSFATLAGLPADSAALALALRGKADLIAGHVPNQQVWPGNAAQQPEKRTRHISLQSIGADPTEDTRDSLDPLTLCLGTRNRAEFGDPPISGPQNDILVYDGAARPAGQPGLMVYRDGKYSGPLVAARWVSTTATAAFLLAYSADPKGYVYTAGDYRRAYVPDAVQEQFFQALFSGSLAAPSSVNGDANWAHVNAANVPTAAVVPAQNSLQGNLTSYRTPPSVDAVNAGLALKANTADVAATIQSITTLDASQTAAIAAAQALLSTDGNLITAITSTQTTQGASIATNTQNITANATSIATNTAALLGKFANQGNFTPGTTYNANDVVVQAGNAYFRQLGTFAPAAFVATDWVAFSTPQFTPAQVATFLASASPVLILPASGAPIGYNTLDAALSVANRIQPTSVILNTGLFTIQTSNPTRGFANWPAYFDARGATIQINDGITLTASGGSQITCVVTNIFIVGQTANTGVFSIPAGYSPIALTAATAAQLVDCSVSIPILFNGGYATLINGYYKSLTGTGTVYLYGNVQADSIASTLTIVDRRPGATAPAVATATTAGTVKIGSGITVTADGTISAAASGGATAAGGVFRGAFAAVAYAQYDCIIIPSGQANAGLLAYATTAFTATATYSAANWTLDPGQSSNDYTAADVARLGVGVALATTATDLSSAINEVRNTLPGTTERSAAYTLALTDAGNVVPVNSATALALTIPSNASVAFPIGTIVNVSQVGAGQVLVTAGTGVTIRQADAQFKTAKQWAEVSLRKRGTDEWVLTGYTAA